MEEPGVNTYNPRTQKAKEVTAIRSSCGTQQVLCYLRLLGQVDGQGKAHPRQTRRTGGQGLRQRAPWDAATEQRQATVLSSVSIPESTGEGKGR